MDRDGSLGGAEMIRKKEMIKLRNKLFMYYLN